MYKELIIGGCPRSGTTALAALLSHDSNTLITQELGNYICPADKFHNRMRYVLNEKDAVRYLIDKNIDLVAFNVECKDHPEFVNQFLVERNPQLQIVGDKYPDYLLSAPYILRENDNIKMIVCIRDPRDVALSSCRHYFGKDSPPWTHSNIEDALNMWEKYYSRLLALYNNEKLNIEGRIHIVKYEEAVQNIGKILDEIEDFIDSDLLIGNPEGGYYPVHLNEWQKPENIHKFQDIPPKVKLLMKIFGYSV